MGVPAYTRSWTQQLTTGVPGTRITFVSLADCMGNYIYGLKTFLLANSCTVLWSASGGTGPTNSSDHTDRITSSATWTPRATTAGASQAWVVLTDGNAGQLLLSYTGSTDDVGYMSYSASASFALAGTTNNRPTATDEMAISSATTLISATASADRVWQGWATSDGKNYRFAVFRSSALVGQIWGVEGLTLPTLPGNVTFTPASGVWAFCFSSGSIVAASSGGIFATYAANVNGGLTRATISSVGFSVQCTASSWGFNNTFAPGLYTAATALQGSVGLIPWPMVLLSSLASANGYVGALVDWYACSPTSFASGDGFGSAYDWMQVGAALWPNPSLQAPTIA